MPLHSGAPAFRGLDPARCGGRMGRTAGGRVGMALGTLAAGGAACVAYGVLIERHWYRLRHETVPALKPGQPPCTVLHLSDFHLLADDTRRQRFLAELAEVPADLVVVTGDILGEPSALDAALKSLSRFHPRFGSVAVLGSNDYYAPQPKNYLSYFRRRRTRRLPARAGRPHPRGPGPPPRGGRAGDQLRPAARAGPRAVALGLHLAARERRPRHQQVRALPLRLPPRGDPAHPGPGLSSGPGASVPGARGRIMEEGAGVSRHLDRGDDGHGGVRQSRQPAAQAAGPRRARGGQPERAIALLY